MHAAERSLRLISEAQVSGSATQWRSALRRVLTTHADYEPVKAISLAESTVPENLAKNFKSFFGLFGDMLDHPIFPFLGAGFYGMARDHHGAADILSQAVAKFGHRYDLDSGLLYHTCAAKPKKVVAQKALDEFLTRYSELPVAYHTGSYVAQRFVSPERAAQITDSLLSYFPNSNVAHSARRDQAYFQGNLAMALGFARVVVSNDRCSALGWITLAEMLVEIGNREEAVTAATTALDLAPLRREIIDRYKTVCSVA